jgi:hypothetical protein
MSTTTNSLDRLGSGHLALAAFSMISATTLGFET